MQKPNDQTVVQAVGRMFAGKRLQEVVQSEKGIMLIFETKDEQVVSMILTPHLNVNLGQNNLNATVSLNITTTPPLTLD